MSQISESITRRKYLIKVCRYLSHFSYVEKWDEKLTLEMNEMNVNHILICMIFVSYSYDL